MFGLSISELLILAVLFVPVILLIIGLVLFVVITGTVFVRHKVLHHY